MSLARLSWPILWAVALACAKGSPERGDTAKPAEVAASDTAVVAVDSATFQSAMAQSPPGDSIRLVIGLSCLSDNPGPQPLNVGIQLIRRASAPSGRDRPDSLWVVSPTRTWRGPLQFARDSLAPSERIAIAFAELEPTCATGTEQAAVVVFFTDASGGQRSIATRDVSVTNLY